MPRPVIQCACGARVHCEHAHANQCATCCREYRGDGVELTDEQISMLHPEDYDPAYDADYLDDHDSPSNIRSAT